MKKKIGGIGLCMLWSILTCAQTITPQAEQRAKDIVTKMTLQEKIEYISGYTSFSLRAIPRLGIPEIKLADGPQGIRNHAPKSTLYPSGILSASTWNRELLYKLGQGLGQDAKARGVNILLGPGVNIYRAPLCGRNFEYFGDPYLTGETAKQYILGVQSEGVIATIKHFAANNQEWSRHHASSDIDERTLQEIYFPAFRKAVQEANVGAVMNSYNLLNGVHATEHKWLNIDVLRNLWGFKGILMSDWTSVYSAVGAANAGLDLEMPKGRFMNLENLLPAIKTGTVTEETINLKVQHILQTLIAYGMLDKEQKDSNIAEDNPFSRQTALELAREGVVLLKNEGNLLPLKGKTAVMGPNANLIPTGGGSGFVTPFSTVSVAQGLKELKKKNLLLLTDDVIYEDIVHEFYTDANRQMKGFKAEYFKNKTLSGQPEVIRTESSVDYDWGYGAPLDGFPTDGFSVRWTACYMPQTDGQLKLHIGGDDGYRLFVNDKHITGDWGNHSYSSREVELPVEGGKEYRFRIEFFDNISSAIIRFNAYSLNEAKLRQGLAKVDNVVFCTGFNSNTEGEGFDRPFALLRYQELFIKKIASMHPNVVVVLNAGGGVDFTNWYDAAKAILMAWYPGQEGGRAIAEILTGRINPSGRLPITVERRAEDNPTFDSYRANVAQVYNSPLRVSYDEGVFVGYRGYDRAGTEPMYPFGYGLSYTTFDYANLKMERLDDGNVVVSFEVTNTGRFAGSEVAQLYVGDEVASVPRPEKELKGYEKVRLEPGETKSVEIRLSPDAFAFYDMNRHDFVVEPGDFTISVGASSRDIRLSEKIRID